MKTRVCTVPILCAVLLFSACSSVTTLQPGAKSIVSTKQEDSLNTCKVLDDIVITKDHWTVGLCNGNRAMPSVLNEAKNRTSEVGGNRLFIESHNSSGCSATIIGKALLCEGG